MIGQYDKEEENHLTNEVLLVKIQESIQKEAAEIRKGLPQMPYPMMYPYMLMAVSDTPKTEKTKQVKPQIKTPETEKLNGAALNFMDSFMGG